jgi:hypothetical protein
MRKILICLFVFSIFTSAFLRGQQNDAYYMIHLISDADSLDILFVPITIYSNGVNVKVVETDDHGLFLLNAADTQTLATVIVLHIRGYYDYQLNRTTLVPGKSSVIVMREMFVDLQPIEIKDYVAPVIEKQKWRRTRKKIINTDTAYSDEQISAYQKLSAGTWIPADSLKSDTMSGESELYKYFRSTLNYPRKAYDNQAEDIIRMSFELDENGNPKNIKLVKGQNPAMALEVANAIAGMPRLNKHYYYDPSNMRYTPLIFVLTVEFSLIK